MTYQTFTRDPIARRRYWARSHLGWHTIGQARPNVGHRAVAQLQQRGALDGIVTQNVDGLHQAAGARDVVELHGNLARITCLACGASTPREAMAARLDAANPAFAGVAVAFNADGDAELADESSVRSRVAAGRSGGESLDGFTVVDCLDCGGMLKPDVVYFGETVPPERVARSFELVENCRTLLVLGSSLTVMSGRRFVLRAVKHGIRVAIVNRGVTRGEPYASLHIDAPLGIVLPHVAPMSPV
jgi:NAD-dependent SIR2 family protein deacetylase